MTKKSYGCLLWRGATTIAYRGPMQLQSWRDLNARRSKNVIPYPAERRAQTRFIARIEPARDCPLRLARAKFSTQSRFYQSAGYGIGYMSREIIW